MTDDPKDPEYVPAVPEYEVAELPVVDPLVTGDDVGSAKENPEPVNAPTLTDEEAAKDGLPVDPTINDTQAT